MKRANNHLEVCEDMTCKYNMSGECCYGGRNSLGCYILMSADTREWEEFKTIKLAMAEMLEEDEDKKRRLGKYLRKNYRFVYRGHEYTVEDSARCQDECPHCGHKKPHTDSTVFWDEEDEGYIGTYTDGRDEIRCFECQRCFEKFFYHWTFEEVE